MAKHPRRHVQASFNGENLIFQSNQSLWTVSLSDILKIEAYKRDDFTVDTVCVEVFIDNVVFTFNEDQPNFKAVMDALAAHLPGWLFHWREVVIPDPFEEHRTLLYARNGGT